MPRTLWFGVTARCGVLDGGGRVEGVLRNTVIISSQPFFFSHRVYIAVSFCGDGGDDDDRAGICSYIKCVLYITHPPMRYTICHPERVQSTSLYNNMNCQSFPALIKPRRISRSTPNEY